MDRGIDLFENYIYLYHLTDENGDGTYLILPTIPQTIQETLGSSFNATNILSRSAPIFTYQYSGPRTVQVTLQLHRDMMYNLNYGTSNMKLDVGEDYVDTLINYLQSIALPRYMAENKMVNPPIIGVRFGNDTYIKGVVLNGISTQKTLPLLANGKYAQVQIGFTVYEIDPYDADTVVSQGFMRGLSTTLVRTLYKNGG